MTLAPTASSTTAALGEQVLRLHRAFNGMRQQLVGKSPTSGDGVEWAAYGLLFQLVGTGPQRSSTLAETACVDPSTVSRQVAQLVKAGLVERQSDPEDGRASLLVATAARPRRLPGQAGAPRTDVRPPPGRLVAQPTSRR